MASIIIMAQFGPFDPQAFTQRGFIDFLERLEVMRWHEGKGIQKACEELRKSHDRKNGDQFSLVYQACCDIPMLVNVRRLTVKDMIKKYDHLKKENRSFNYAEK